MRGLERIGEESRVEARRGLGFLGCGSEHNTRGEDWRGEERRVEASRGLGFLGCGRVRWCCNERGKVIITHMTHCGVLL